MLPPTVTSDSFSAHAELVTDSSGRDEVLVVAKAAWSVPFGGSPELETAEVHRVALLHEERAGSPIRTPSDLAPMKPGTEVLLLGHARHPAAYPDARWVEVTLSVEGERTLLRKSLRVFGPRRWVSQGGILAPSEPDAYADVALRWEHAFGGRGHAGTHPHNPIGIGMDRVEGAPCHAIEYAAGADANTPAGFGAIAQQWEPRRSRAGAAADDDLAPHPPASRDPRHYCSAADDQWIAEPLVGGEMIVVTGVHARAAWMFTIPQMHPEIGWRVRGRSERARPHLDTVICDADAERVTLCWRSRFLAPRNLADLESITVRPVFVETPGESRPLESAAAV